MCIEEGEAESDDALKWPLQAVIGFRIGAMTENIGK
jgi:hypothetical protein